MLYITLFILSFQQWNQQQQQQQGGAGGILQARLNPGQKQGGDNPTLKGLLNQGPQGPSQPQLGVNISLLILKKTIDYRKHNKRSFERSKSFKSLPKEDLGKSTK